MTTSTWRDWDVRVLDHEYSPSAWVGDRLPREKVVPHHCDVLERESKAAASAAASVEMDVKYDDKKLTQIDFYWTEESPQAPRPILAFIHGGYWQAMGKEHAGYIATTCGGAVDVAAIGYDLCPSVSLAEQVRQVEAAVVFIHKRHPDRPLFIGGHSAGAHLAMMVVLGNKAPIAGTILLSGVFDLLPIRASPVNENNLLGLTTEEDALAVSPAHLLSLPQSLAQKKFLVIVGERDAPEFRRQSREFVQLIQRRDGLTVGDLHTIPDRDHFSLCEYSVYPQDHVAQLLAEFVQKTA